MITLCRISCRIPFKVNDNAPQFAKKVFTGVLTTDAAFKTVFVQVKVSNPLIAMRGLTRCPRAGVRLDASLLRGVAGE